MQVGLNVLSPFFHHFFPLLPFSYHGKVHLLSLLSGFLFNFSASEMGNY